MGYHTFFVKFGLDGTVHFPELHKIAKKYGFTVQKETWLSRGVKCDEYSNYFTCTREATGIYHWWEGGENGLEKKAKALAWDIEQHLKKHSVIVDNIQLVYLPGSVEKK